MQDLIDRKTLLDILSKWRRNVQKSLYPGLMKTTILDTLDHVIEDVNSMKTVEPVHIETNIFDKEEIFQDCTVQVLTNTVTGEVSVGWWRNDK